MGTLMWKRASVCRKSPTIPGKTVAAPSHSRQSRRIAPSLVLVLAILLLSLPAAAEQLIVKVILNQEEKGDFFVNRNETGDFLVKTEDMKAIGFREPTGTTIAIEGDPYLSLHSMTGVQFAFDADTLSLVITAPPSLLGKKIINFKAPQLEKVYYPRDSSVFLNYGADYVAGSGFSFSSFSLANQLGIRTKDLLFLSDSTYTKSQDQERFVRMQSSVTYDDRKELRRFIAGDFFATSGDLGSSLNLGGVSFTKVYRIDPYFINYPTIHLAGQVALPSQANIYLNGAQIKSEKLSPGQFELRNISYYGGAGVLDVVIKDAFGREQRINYPFYFADSFLLKQGLQEYSYNLGFLRDQFGFESNRYTDLAFSAFHRYGLSDWATIGFSTEGKNNLYNLGPRATFLAGNAGIFSLALAGSTGQSSTTGAACLASYLYQGLSVGSRFSLAGFSKKYSIVTSGTPADKTKFQASAGISYTNRRIGSLSFDYTTTKKYVGQDQQTAAVTYTHNLTSEITISSIFRRVKNTDYSNEFFLSLSYTPKLDIYFNASYESTKGVRNEVLEVQKNPPVGEGYGYRAILGKSNTDNQASYSVNPSLQYNARYGIYRGEYANQLTSGQAIEQYHLSTSGALVYIGNTFGLTRPVYDSFGLVQVGNLEGVKVLVNSQEIGTTDSSGKVFVPTLGSYYQNQVGINDKEIPIDYYLSHVVKLVSPPLRSGSCINFAAKKLQPITGMLKINSNGTVKPLEFLEVSLSVDGKDVTFPTGTGGEFYIDISQSEEFKKLAAAEENGCPSIAAGTSVFIKPGSYEATVTYEGKRQTFTVTIPSSTDPIIDLGQIIFDGYEGKPAEPTVEPVAPSTRLASKAATETSPLRKSDGKEYPVKK